MGAPVFAIGSVREPSVLTMRIVAALAAELC